MNLFYTSRIGLLRLCSFSFVLLMAGQSYSQSNTTTCSTVIGTCSGSSTESFTGSAAGFTSSANFSYNGNFFENTNLAGTPDNFTITSRSFSVVGNGSTKIGFDLSSTTGTLNSYIIQVYDSKGTSSTTDDVLIADCNTTPATQDALRCITINDADILANLKIYFVITLNATQKNNGQKALRFDNFQYNAAELAALPVKLSTFSAARSGNKVYIKWATATEAGNKGFEIQRRLDGKNEFETIAFVASKANGGNSDATLAYEFTDANSGGVSSQYRIKQIDIDGMVKYSDTRIVDGSKLKAGTIIYPNPSNKGIATLVFNNNESRDIKVLDINGWMLQHWNAYTNAELKLTGLEKGSYLITVQNNVNNQKETLRAVVFQ